MYKSCFIKNAEITAAHFLAEQMLRRQAGRDQIELKGDFWKSKRWANEFRRQAFYADSLLKKFSMNALVNAFNSPRGMTLYTLDAEKVITEIVDDMRLPSRPRPIAKVKTLLAKLKEL